MAALGWPLRPDIVGAVGQRCTSLPGLDRLRRDFVIVQIGLAGYGAFFAASEVEGSTIDEDTFSRTASAFTPASATVVLTLRF